MVKPRLRSTTQLMRLIIWWKSCEEFTGARDGFEETEFAMRFVSVPFGRSVHYIMLHHWPLLVATAFAASTIAAIAGTGGGIILLPVLVGVFGVRDAVPIYAVAQLIGNLSRVTFNRPKIDYKVVKWFAMGAIPCAIFGSWLFTRLPDTGLLRFLGGFLILSTIARRLYPASQSGFRPLWFAPVGGIFATISAIVGSAGKDDVNFKRRMDIHVRRVTGKHCRSEDIL